MMDVISAFQYKERDTLLNRLDPRSKLLMVFSIILFLWLSGDLRVMAFGLIPVSILVIAGKLWGDLRGALRLYFILGVLLVPLNSLLHSIYSPIEGGSSTVLLQITRAGTPILGELFITQEALEFSVVIYSRLVLMLVVLSVFTMTTSLDKLEALLFKLRFPYFFVLTLSFTFRFIPTIVLEAQRIREAQMARGLDPRRGGFFRRHWNGVVPILLPLAVSTLRRSIRFAEALEARGTFAFKERTTVLRLNFQRLDAAIASASLVLLVSGLFLVRVFPVF